MAIELLPEKFGPLRQLNLYNSWKIYIA